MSGPVSKVHAVRVVGPLAPFADGFKARLGELGYAPLTTVNELKLVLHVSRWLDAGGLSAADLTPDRVDAYFVARRAAGYRSSTTPRSLTQLVGFLTDSGVLSAPSNTASGSQADALLDAFEVFLIDERGLAGCTAKAYVARARRFVSSGSIPSTRICAPMPRDAPDLRSAYHGCASCVWSVCSITSAGPTRIGAKSMSR